MDCRLQVRLAILFFFANASLYNVYAQKMPVLAFGNQQLLREVSLVYMQEDSLLNLQRQALYSPKEILNQHGIALSILPLINTSQYFSSHPIAYLNGSMINGNCFQNQLTNGIVANWKNVSLQLMPEWIFAPDPAFAGFSHTNSTFFLSRQYNWWNRIDLAENYSGTYHSLNFGQSFIRYRTDLINFKISHENEFWGPGKYDGLVLTNNGPGFWHISVENTNEIPIYIGQLNIKWISGILSSSDIVPRDTSVVDRGTQLYFAKPNHDRYFTGIDLTYHPKHFDGLTFGFSNTIQQYDITTNMLDFWGAFTSIFTAFEGSMDNVPKLQVQSFNFRWNLVESNAEVYAEILRQNPQKRLDQWYQDPQKNRAWLLGVAKYWPISKYKGWQLDLELTQLQQPARYAIKNGPGIYTDAFIRQGYTHKGEVLGSSLYPGSNRQQMNIAYWFNGNRIGLNTQRIANNMDLYYHFFDHNNDFRRYWVDMIFGLKAFFKLNQTIYINSQISYIYTYNYQWEHTLDEEQPYFAPGDDIQQIHCNVSVLYNF